ncbi:MAG: hypothetical protein L0I76_13450 [Pseudonocardia sp.]|nr:hypothetical protein [Pseudonocardia sp.]
MNAGEADRSPERDGRMRVGHRLRELVLAAAVEVFGAVRSEVPIEGFRLLTESRLDDPLAGVRAADLLARVADAQRTDHARAARAAGRSWDEIGEALELPLDGDRPRGEAAFEWLIEGRAPESTGPADGLFRTPTTWWRCSACGQQVSDRGPYESHPDDNEHGHTEGCPRRAAAIGAWRTRTAAEGEL